MDVSNNQAANQHRLRIVLLCKFRGGRPSECVSATAGQWLRLQVPARKSLTESLMLGGADKTEDYFSDIGKLLPGFL